MFWLKQNSKIFYLFLIILITIPVLIPLFHKGFFITDDGEWMIIRFSAFYSAIRDGQFPVRFLHRLYFGYGYPVPTFLYPGFMYFAVPIHLLKIGFITTIKIIIGISLFGTTIFTYFWLSKFFNRISSLLGSIFSLYIPYHMYDIFTRGSVGEIFALLWIPYIFWMIERKSIFFTAIGISFLLISHNSLAAIFLPIIIFYMALNALNSPNKKAQLYYYICVLVVGLGMAAFFLLPAIFELSLTNFSKIKVSDPFSYFANIQLIGYSTIFILIIALLFLFKISFKKTKQYKEQLFIFFLIVTLLCVFLSSSASRTVWYFLPSSFIQFPFRLLSIFLLSVPFLIAFITSKLQKKYQTMFIIASLIILIFSVYKFINIQTIDKDDGYYSTNDATTTVQDEYLPVWVKEKVSKRPADKVEIVEGQGKIENVLSTNKKISFNLNLAKNSLVRVNTIYWPGWNALVDDKNTKITYQNPKGVMELHISQGKHRVQLIFQETSLRIIADIISSISFLLLIFVSLKRYIK